ncbi:MAG: hypothetical protein AB8G05_25680 [Oligoflexales bacterium]
MSLVKEKIKSINKKIWWISLMFGCYLFPMATQSYAKERIIPKIIKCAVPKSKKGKVCIIETDKGVKGTRVSIYNQNHYWIATGKIYKRKGNKAVVVMKHTIQPIFPTYSIEVGKATPWKQSFSNYDSW